MTDGREPAAQPEDITRLFVERANAGDAEGLAALNANRPTHISGRIYRIMMALMPRSLLVNFNGRMLHKAATRKQARITG